MNFVFLATCQLYFNCIVKYYIIFWQNKVMMMMKLTYDEASDGTAWLLQRLRRGGSFDRTGIYSCCSGKIRRDNGHQHRCRPVYGTHVQ